MSRAHPNPTGPADRARRVEIVLEHIDGLPTLSPIATRLLALSSAEDADLSEIINLIEADPALTGRMLALCRKAHLGLTHPVTTVRKAVVMLGLEAVQSAVLSVQVLDFFGKAPGSDETPDYTARGPEAIDFDRPGFWKHSLAVACASELLADAHRALAVRPDEAFTAGLLHDIGKVVLHWVLPRSYARVLEIARTRCGPLAEVERAILGLDHHTAGKRLGERWGLPHTLLDPLWLHDQPTAALPDVPHKPLIALVTAADALCRRLHLGWSGSCAPTPTVAEIAAAANLDPVRIEALTARLHDLLARRCADLGLSEQPAPALMLESIVAANERLLRLNQALVAKAATARRHSRALKALGAFMNATRAAQTVAEGVGAIAASVAALADGPLGRPTFVATIAQARADQPFRIARHEADGVAISWREVDPPLGSGGVPVDLSSLAGAGPHAVSTGLAAPIALATFLAEHLNEPGTPAPDLRALHSTVVDTGTGPAAIIITDRPLADLDPEHLEALTSAYAGCLAAAAQTQGARRLGEALAQTSRVLAESQEERARARAIAQLSEVTAGMAHEINNPLAIVSGRSQLLASRLKNYKDKSDAQEVADAAHRVSDLVTRLHQFARPPEPNLRRIIVVDVIRLAVQMARVKAAQPARVGGERLLVPATIPDALLDPDLLSAALAEVIRNGIEAAGEHPLELCVRVDSADGRLSISVKDRGMGMSDTALAHAFDPFFSEKPAGRQVGVGLALARRFVQVMGGDILLESAPGRGTTATIFFPTWRAGAESLVPAVAA